MLYTHMSSTNAILCPFVLRACSTNFSWAWAREVRAASVEGVFTTEGTKGVPRNGGRKRQLVFTDVCFQFVTCSNPHVD